MGFVSVVVIDLGVRVPSLGGIVRVPGSPEQEGGDPGIEVGVMTILRGD